MTKTIFFKYFNTEFTFLDKSLDNSLNMNLSCEDLEVGVFKLNDYGVYFVCNQTLEKPNVIS